MSKVYIIKLEIRKRTQKMKYMNTYLRAALAEVCAKEGTTPSAWAMQTEGISHPQISRLSSMRLRKEAFQALCKKENWRDPKSSADIVIACINDYLTDVLGRSPEEFKVRATGKDVDLELEASLRTLEEFARNSSGAIELIKTMAAIVNDAQNPFKGACAKDLNLGEAPKRKTHKAAK